MQVGEATIVYEGTTRQDGRYVARFRVSGQLPSPLGALYVLPSGPSAELSRTGEVVTSEPFALASADPSTLFSWRIGSETLVWELGPVQS